MRNKFTFGSLIYSYYGMCVSESRYIGNTHFNKGPWLCRLYNKNNRGNNELSKSQVNDFINWYNVRSAGSGLPHYTFNKDFNLGPFQSRKDYLVFDKIQASK